MEKLLERISKGEVEPKVSTIPKLITVETFLDHAYTYILSNFDIDEYESARFIILDAAQAIAKEYARA